MPNDCSDPKPKDGSLTVVAEDGDLIVQIVDHATSTNLEYRCSRTVIRKSSDYFNVLLDPEKFSEGIAINSRLQELRHSYERTLSIPISKLPKVVVRDVGHLPRDISLKTAVTLFFSILHDHYHTWQIVRSQSIQLVSMLAIIADRLSATEPIATYLRRQGLETSLLKDRKSATIQQLVIDNRQRLLAGLILGFPEWVRRCSISLIVDGSKGLPVAIRTKHEAGDGEEDDEKYDALWWSLPGGVEGTAYMQFCPIDCGLG